MPIPTLTALSDPQDRSELRQAEITHAPDVTVNKYFLTDPEKHLLRWSSIPLMAHNNDLSNCQRSPRHFYL
jgi:hypothetical protein